MVGSSTWVNSKMVGYNITNLLVQALASRSGYKYRCVITDENGNKATSSPAILTVRMGKDAALQATEHSEQVNKKTSEVTKKEMTESFEDEDVEFVEKKTSKSTEEIDNVKITEQSEQFTDGQVHEMVGKELTKPFHDGITESVEG